LAIAIEFVNVIVHKPAVEARFPGGLDGFVRQELCNYLEDQHLVRVGFMSGRDAFAFVKELENAGLCYSDEVESDIAVITCGNPALPSWLTVGECEGLTACWLTAQPPGRLVQLDRGILLRCRAFKTVGEIVSVFCDCSAEVREGDSVEGSIMLECQRGVARVQVEVFLDGHAGCPIAVLSQRDLRRRTLIVEDVALMRDLECALKSIEEKSGRAQVLDG